MVRAVHEIARELVVSLRQCRRVRGTLVGLTLTIGVSVGANLVMFAWLYATLARTGPVPDAGRLVVIENTGGYNGERSGSTNQYDRRLSTSDFELLTQQQRTLTAVGAFNLDHAVVLSGGDRPRTALRIFVLPGTLEALGVSPALGRRLTDRDFEPVAPGAVLLSDDIWRRSFGADTRIVGRSIELDEQPFTVVGVLPRNVMDALQPRRRLLEASENPLYVATPLVRGMAGEAERVIEYVRHKGDVPWLLTIGRVHAGVAAERVAAEVSVIGERLRGQNSRRPPDFTLRVVPFERWRTARVRTVLVMLGVAAGLMLLVAWANAAGLFLAERIRQAQEFTTRHALGASPRHLLTVVAVRALVWSLPGGLLGVLLATVAPGLLAAGLSLPSPAAASPFGRVLQVAAGGLLTLAVALATAVAAEWSLRGRAFGHLKDGDRGVAGQPGRRRAAVLLGMQIAAAVALTMGGGLLLRSIWVLTASDYGFELQHGFVQEVRLPRSRFPGIAEQVQYFDHALARLHAVPGIEAAAFSSSPPLTDSSATIADIALQTATGTRPLGAVSAQFVSRGYFEALGMKLVRGRFLSPGDEPWGAAVVVDESFCHRFLGKHDPLGSYLLFGREALAIVGVVRDARQFIQTGAVDGVPRSSGTVYLSFKKYTSAPTWRFLVVRSRLAGPDVSRIAVRELLAVDPSVVLGDPRTFRDLLRAKTAEQRRLSALLGGMACIVMLLTGASTAAALNQLVTLRGREIALRYCLGATRRTIVTYCLKHLGMALGGGLVLGVAGGLLVGRGLAALLYGIGSFDLPNLASAVGLLAVIGLVAAIGPLRRAFRIDASDTVRDP